MRFDGSNANSHKPETPIDSYTSKISRFKRCGTLAESATAKGFRHALR
jgi:hypothetical protein